MTLFLEANEYQLLVALMERAASRHPILVLHDYEVLMKKLYGAPEVEEDAVPGTAAV